jgi:hypothetical protein
MPIRSRSLKHNIALQLAINPINKQPFYLVYQVEDGYPPRPIGAVTFEKTANGFKLTEVINATWTPFIDVNIESVALAEMIDSAVVNFLQNVSVESIDTENYYAKIGFTGTAMLRTIPRAYATSTYTNTFVLEEQAFTQQPSTQMITDVPALVSNTISVDVNFDTNVQMTQTTSVVLTLV